MSETSRDREPRVVVTYLDGSVGLECAFCGGGGVFPETAFDDPDCTTTARCPVCDGVGFNVFPGDSEGFAACRYCDASGKAWDESGYFRGDACGVCGGRGFLDLSAVRRSASAGANADVWALIHPDIRAVAKPRFDAGHFADAVEAAFKHFNAAVKSAVPESVAASADGAALMKRVFSPRDPVLALDDLTTQSGRDIQLGYMEMFAGAMTGIRNPKAHDNVVIDELRALHLLFVASLFCLKLDEAEGVI